MLSRSKMLPAVTALFLSSIACATLVGEPTPAPVVTKLPIVNPAITKVPVTEMSSAETPVHVACPAVTNKIMDVSLSGGSDEDLSDEEVHLVTYTVSGDEISDPYYDEVGANLQEEQEDFTAHQQIWSYFTSLIPAGSRTVIGEYSIVTDGRDGTLAAVTQTQDDPNKWALEVDVADSYDYYGLTFTLIHEFGHLLTLGPDQVLPSIAVFDNPENNDIYLEEASKCPRYFPGEGCANADSYINAYYNQFWKDIYEEWNNINLEEDEDAYYARLDEFYYHYEDQFVTDYAVTNPEEDIAETWAFFVLGTMPAGDTIAEEKILFFRQYPELVKLRQAILDNLCIFFP